MDTLPPTPAALAATQANPARAIRRAIGEMRAGVPLVLAGEASLLVLPADTATDAGLAEVLAQAAGAPPLLLLAGTRAEAAAPGGPVALALTKEDLGRAALLALADCRPASRPRAPVPPGAAAALKLARLARLLPAVFAVPLAGPAAGLLRVPAADVLGYAPARQALVRVAEAAVPIADAAHCRVVAFRPEDGGLEHLAVLIGEPERAAAPLVRLHSECFTGDLLGSLRCDCGPQLHGALRLMAAEGAGVLLYLPQEGRGIGLVNKLRAYALQDAGLDTLDANLALGFAPDERSFAPAAAMLRALAVPRVRLLTNNPAKLEGLAACGIQVAGRVPHAFAGNGINDSYLATKAERFGHLLA